MINQPAAQARVKYACPHLRFGLVSGRLLYSSGSAKSIPCLGLQRSLVPLGERTCRMLEQQIPEITFTAEMTLCSGF